MTHTIQQSAEVLAAAIIAWKRPRILVLGDVILDWYCWGTVQRISPEAPIPVLQYDRQEHRLGGAAAVAGLLTALGADVVCVGVTGCDAAAGILQDLLRNARVTWNGLEATDRRPTTTKQRFLSSRHGHTQLLRVDYESEAAVGPPIEAALVRTMLAELEKCDAVVISDYAKGVCTSAVLQGVIQAASAAQLPVLVDPARRTHFRDYRGATVLVPNRHEAELVAGERLDSSENALQLGREFCRQWEVQVAVVKLDQEGIVLLHQHDAPQHFPTSARQVFDVTGAGDTVIAVLAMCLSSGQLLEVACQLANIAGGVQVQRVGVFQLCRADLQAAVTGTDSRSGVESCILNLSEATRRTSEARLQGKRVVFTNGCFAALHAGHVASLQEARALGDMLIVGCNSAESIRRIKGERPIIPDAERLQLLAALSCVDGVLLFDEDTPHRMLETIRPDILAKGGTTDIIVGREIVEAYGGQVIRLSVTPGISTTQLLASATDDVLAGVEHQ
jgi:D-beta-D-heptose 7-phosphate kinase/D-beta-D-heptose 1-phosphate adenosyltransferase